MVGPGVQWAIVVPVKRLAVAKTRLAVDPALRADLALAMALDTVSAALATPTVAVVVAVSDDERAIAHLTSCGALVVADEPDAGLNPALEHGAHAAVDAASARAVAALASDLPALRPDDLDRALRAAAAGPCACVGDAQGSGTTLLAASDAAEFHPQFGPGSRARHVAAGAVDLTDAAAASLRRDVDTLDDLRTAVRLGCGPETSRLVNARVKGLDD